MAIFITASRFPFKSIFGMLFTLAVLAGPIFSLSTSLSPTLSQMPEVTCKAALDNVGRVKAGSKASDVTALLGEPNGIEKGVWVYNFSACSPPPKAGEQKIVGLVLTFVDGARQPVVMSASNVGLSLRGRITFFDTW